MKEIELIILWQKIINSNNFNTAQSSTQAGIRGVVIRLINNAYNLNLDPMSDDVTVKIKGTNVVILIKVPSAANIDKAGLRETIL